MLAHGHPNAWEYPLGRLDDEIKLVNGRVSREHAKQASLFNLAVAAVINKDAVRDFNTKLKELNNG